jgi:hypothetical protein
VRLISGQRLLDIQGLLRKDCRPLDGCADAAKVFEDRQLTLVDALDAIAFDCSHKRILGNDKTWLAVTD